MDVLGLIPARGGSKAIPNKNLARLGGRPLLSYTVRAAKKSKQLTRLILSTDSPRLARAAKTMRVEVPFLRPKAFAKDQSPMIQVLQHALKALKAKEGYRPDVLVLLQPTSPFRQARHIDGAIRLLKKTKADTVVSVVRVPHQYNPVSIMKKDKKGRLTPFSKGKMILRRQDKPDCFARNGPAVLVVRRAVVEKGRLYGRTVVGFEMGSTESMDIDDRSDLKLAQALLSGKRHR